MYKARREIIEAVETVCLDETRVIMTLVHLTDEEHGCVYLGGGGSA